MKWLWYDGLFVFWNIAESHFAANFSVCKQRKRFNVCDTCVSVWHTWKRKIMCAKPGVPTGLFFLGFFLCVCRSKSFFVPLFWSDLQSSVSSCFVWSTLGSFTWFPLKSALLNRTTAHLVESQTFFGPRSAALQARISFASELRALTTYWSISPCFS